MDSGNSGSQQALASEHQQIYSPQYGDSEGFLPSLLAHVLGPSQQL